VCDRTGARRDLGGEVDGVGTPRLLEEQYVGVEPDRGTDDVARPSPPVDASGCDTTGTLRVVAAMLWQAHLMSELSTDLGRRAWWIDTFIGKGALGNPAVVVLLESALPERDCQQIAAELAVAETAFLRRGRDGWELRCFTPTVEVDLFGHATLASLHVLCNELGDRPGEHVFSTRSGPIAGRCEGHDLVVEMPRHEFAAAPTDEAERALGEVVQAWTTESGDLVCLLDSYDALCGLRPDSTDMFLVPASLVVAVCEGGVDCDVALRVFAPRLGIREDAVTGRAMCALAPIWQERTGDDRLLARQVSARGGVLAARVFDDHVEVIGRAKTFLSGQLWA
jgi:predicted PhzF superfamily epimerase YddE/YHI9